MIHKNLLKKIVQLQKKKYRDEYGLYTVEGVKGAQEAINTHANIEHIFALEEMVDSVQHLSQKCEIQILNKKEAEKIKTTETFPGILAVVHKQQYSEFTDKPIICLDRINDPGNLGTIIRTADWFGIYNILLSEESVDPYNPKVVRATMGSFFRMNIKESTNVVKDLQTLGNEGYTLIRLDMNGTSIEQLPKQQKAVYIFGSESHGIHPDIQEISTAYTIEGKGGAESLNVAIAAGIVLSRV